METKHTLGPWAISSSTMIISSDLKIVGNCTPLGLGAGVDMPLDVCRANARLMAASPDLLEALENALGDLKKNTSAYEIAVEAIAKATGVTL